MRKQIPWLVIDLRDLDRPIGDRARWHHQVHRAEVAIVARPQMRVAEVVEPNWIYPQSASSTPRSDGLVCRTGSSQDKL